MTVQELNIPAVLLTMERHPSLNIVHYDNYFGGRIATEHLLQQGYRHIGHLTGPLDWWGSRQRMEGWQDALHAAGLEPSSAHWAEGNWSFTSGEKAFRHLRRTYPEMDAVFVANDQMALSVMHASCRDGIDIPHRLGVVGFDGLAETPYYWPPLRP